MTGGWTPTKEAPTPTTSALAAIRDDAELLDRVRARLDDVAASAFVEHSLPLGSPEAGAVIRDVVAARGLKVSRFTDWAAVGETFLKERMAAKHDAARLACNAHGGSDHTCQTDPEVEADYAAFVAGGEALPTVRPGDGGAPLNGLEVCAYAMDKDEDGIPYPTMVLISEAEFWSIVATYTDAPSYVIADYPTRERAEAVAARLAAASGVGWLTLEF